jgi:hypothetical protein
MPGSEYDTWKRQPALACPAGNRTQQDFTAAQSRAAKIEPVVVGKDDAAA